MDNIKRPNYVNLHKTSENDRQNEDFSSNCQGLNNEEKRRYVLVNIHTNKENVYCVQDTHFTKHEEQEMKLE